MGLDIGPATIKAYEDFIAPARTVVWNGPMGVFEIARFAEGTNAVARAVAKVSGTTIVGGGDSIAALKQSGVADRITHISTGGGASMEFLGGRTLPGVAALTDGIVKDVFVLEGQAVKAGQVVVKLVDDDAKLELARAEAELAEKQAALEAAQRQWDNPVERTRAVAAAEAMTAEVQAALLSQACVDENRIYATGHSSGAQFIVQLLCSGDADFDGVGNGSVSPTYAFTRAQNSTVTCGELQPGDNLQPGGVMQYADTTYPTFLQGMTCTARAELSGFRIPQNLLEGSGGFSQVRHYRPLVIPVCAVGRPVSGNCPGRLSMLLDDWGYSGQLEARECALGWEGLETCENQGYWDQANAAYQESILADSTPFYGAGSRLAALVAGVSPIEEDAFFMSFRGHESRYLEDLGESHGTREWETTPFIGSYQVPRTRCWLGRGC